MIFFFSQIFDRKFGSGINASVMGGAHLSNYAYAPYIGKRAFVSI